MERRAREVRREARRERAPAERQAHRRGERGEPGGEPSRGGGFEGPFGSPKPPLEPNPKLLRGLGLGAAGRAAAAVPERERAEEREALVRLHGGVQERDERGERRLFRRSSRVGGAFGPKASANAARRRARTSDPDEPPTALVGSRK